MEPAATKLEMIHERLGGDVGVDGIGVLDITDPCVFDSVYYEGATAALGGFLELEIVTQIFVGGLGIGADNVSGFVRDGRVDDGKCGRGKHLVVLRFVGSIRG